MKRRALLIRLLLGTLFTATVALALDPGIAVAQQSLPEGVDPRSWHTVVVTMDESSFAAEQKACRQALGKICDAFVNGTDKAVDVGHELYDQAPAFTDILGSTPSTATEGKTDYSVRVYLVAPPEGKRSVLRALKRLSVLPPLSVAVVVPEQHRIETAFVRVPDPAGETTLAKALTLAGFQVASDTQREQLRDDTVVHALYAGNSEEKDLRDLRKRAPVDVLITGEAFSVETNRNPGAVMPGMVLANAQFEIKAIDMKNGERLCSERTEGSAQRPTGATAGKEALQAAAERLSPRVVNALLLYNAGIGGSGSGLDDATLSLEIHGLGNVTNKNGFLDAVKALPGVRAVIEPEYTGGVLFAQVRVDRKQASEFSGQLEAAPSLSRFHIAVDSDGNNKIVANARPRTE